MSEEETEKNRGRHLPEKELRDWQQVFTDIEGSVENLEEETE